MAKPRKPRSTLTKAQKAMRDEGYCAAKLKRQKGGTTRYCRKECGWGTDHVGKGPCKLHGGSTPNVVKAAQREEAQAAMERYGLPLETDPHSALMDELHRTAGHVHWLRERVAELESDEQLHGPVGVSGTDAESGLEHHAGSQRHIWIQMYQDERKHLTDVAATCIKVGIEERRVRLAEQQGQMIATLLTNVLQKLGIDPRSEKARKVVRKELQTIEGTAVEVPA